MSRVPLALLMALRLVEAALVDMYIINGEYATCPEGYSKVSHVDSLNGDVNEGAGGAYLWICVKYASVSGAETPFDSLAVVGGGSGSTCGGWNWASHDAASNGDLNQGAGGDYIYLCYLRGNSHPIEDITLVEGDCPAGYFRIQNFGADGGDLNNNAGGKYIFMCARRACVAEKVSGSWQQRYQIAAPTQETWKHGTQKTHSESKEEDWAESVTATVSAGFELEAFSASAEISTEFSHSVAQSYSSEWSVNEEYEFSVTWERQDVGKMIWQFEFSPSDSCGHTETTVTRTFALTEGGFRPPCCVPGYATDAPTYLKCASADVMIPDGATYGCRVASQAEMVTYLRTLNASVSEAATLGTQLQRVQGSNGEWGSDALRPPQADLTSAPTVLV